MQQRFVVYGLYILRLRREPPAAPPPAPPGIIVARPPLGERARVPLGVQALFRVLTLPPRRVRSVKSYKRLTREPPHTLKRQ